MSTSGDQQVKVFDPVLTNFLGGYGRNRNSVTIGRMVNMKIEWTHGPAMLLSRWGHRSISVGNEIFHIGGEGTR